MSGMLNSIRKVFKKVVKVVKKVGLPLLAIGAVVLTGGAALGVLPALGGAGGLLASLGIKGVLAGVLTTAAKGAAMGALTSGITGGNIIKGATSGLIMGGVTGGIGAAMGGTAATAAQAAGGMAQSGSTGAADAVTPNMTPLTMAGTDSGGNWSVPSDGSPMAISGSGIGSAAAPQTSFASGPQIARVATTTSAPTAGGGMLGWFNNLNGVTQGSLIQGIGGALTASANAKDARKEREREEASYGDNSGLYGAGSSRAYGASRYDAAIYGGKVKYDPRTGQVGPR